MPVTSRSHAIRAAVAVPDAPRRSAEDPAPSESSPFDGLSRQAIVLYARVLVAGMLEGRTGFIGRREAERLADECGSLVDELVEAGLWRESGLSYLI